MKSRILLFGALLGLSTGSIAQAPQNASGQATFTSRTEVVLVPVAVLHKSGEVASGLKKDDFHLSVDGKSVSVASFEEVKSGSAPSLPTREADVFTNRIANEDRPQRLTVLLLDYVNTPFLNQQEERAEMAKFLQKELKPDEPVALVALTRQGLRLLQSFTTSSGELSLAIQRSRSELGPSDTGGLRWVGPLPQDPSGKMIMEDRIRLTLEELEQLGHALTGVPGRKVVVWTTGGFPFLPFERHSMIHEDTRFVSNYERTWRTLNQANVSLYPIDAKGLVNTIFERRYSAQIGRARNPRPGARPRYDIFQQEQDTLKHFAEETGGVACLNRNQYESCIEAAQREAADYYLLSFTVTPEMRNKPWHKVHVKVDGHYDVRARQGFSVEKAKEPDPKEEMKIMAKALRSPLEYTGLKMSMRWTDVKRIPPDPAAAPAPEKSLAAKYPPVAVARFRMEFAPRSVEIDTANQNRVGLTLMAVCIQYDEYVCEMAKGIETHLDETQLQHSDTKGTLVDGDIQLPAGRLRVRFAVRDRQTGEIGTVEAPITVR